MEFPLSLDGESTGEPVDLGRWTRKWKTWNSELTEWPLEG